MSKIWWLGLLALVVTGCKKSSEPMEPAYEGQQGQWQPVPPVEEPIEEDQGLAGLPEAQPPMNLQDALGTLRTNTERLRTTEDTDHAALVSALRATADAVAALPGVEDPQGYRVAMMTYADRIQTTDPASMEHADHAKAALKETVSVLQKVGNQRELEGFEARMNVLDESVANIAGNTSLLEQRELVASTFDQLTDAIQSLSTAPARGTE